MPTIPKPQPCDQRWLNMTPTANGRRCDQCAKEIYDFSAMSWAQIEQLQATHGNALCGLYTPAQLKHWGQQPHTSCASLAGATALALALSSLPAQGQTTGVSTTPIITLSGTVTGTSDKGKVEPVPGAVVVVAGTNQGTTADVTGHYQLEIPAVAGTTLLYTLVGYSNVYWTLPAGSTGSLQHDIQLGPTAELPNFYVKFTLTDRIKWRFKRWFTSGE